jgi:hypothetical protein
MGSNPGLRREWLAINRLSHGAASQKGRRGKPRRRWKDNIEIDLNEREFGGRWGVNCINVAWYGNGWWVIINTVMNLRAS